MAARVLALGLAAVTLGPAAAPDSSSSGAAPPHVQYMTWYGCEPAAQHGSFANLCIDDQDATLLEAAALGMKAMKEVTWSFFRNAEAPRSGLMLRGDYLSGWAQQWEARHGGIQPLAANGTLIGVFLGGRPSALSPAPDPSAAPPDPHSLPGPCQHPTQSLHPTHAPVRPQTSCSARGST